MTKAFRIRFLLPEDLYLQIESYNGRIIWQAAAAACHILEREANDRNIQTG